MTLPDRPTGAELAAAIRREAHRRNQSLTKFAAPLASQPGSWVRSIEDKLRPSPRTVERVRALLAGEPLPPPLYARPKRLPTLAERAAGAAESPDAALPAIQRSPDPCFRCGTRGGLPCPHRPEEGQPL